MANYTQVAQNATRTIIIPKGILNPDQINVINIPRNQNVSVPLLVLPRRDGRGVLARSLPIWNDELSDRTGAAGIEHLVGVSRECSSKSKSQNKTYSLGGQKKNEDFSLSSIYDSSAEIDEKEANMFKNIMDGKYNVIKRMSASPERFVPKLPEYWDGQGFRPRHLSTPIPNTQQLYMNDTSFPSTMYSQDFFTPEFQQTRSNEQPNSTFLKPNATYNQPNTTFAQPNATYNQPNTTFAQPNATYNQPNTTFAQPNATYNQPNTTFAQPNARYIPADTTFAQPRTGYCKPISRIDSPVTCGDYSAAPFGTPDTRSDGPRLPYQSPPSQTQSFPQLRRSNRQKMSSQLGRSVDVPPASQTLGVGGGKQLVRSIGDRGQSPPGGISQNYSAAPFGIPIDARFEGSYLPYDAPPELARTYPQPTMRQGGIQRRGASLCGYGRSAGNASGEQQRSSQLGGSIGSRLESSTGTYQNYSAAPFGIPIDTRFTDSYPLPHYAPPEMAQTYPRPTMRQGGIQRPGTSLDGCGIPARNVGREQQGRPQLDRYTSSRLDSSPSETYQNYSAAPFGIPIDTRFADSYPLSYYAPPEMAQTYPRPTMRRGGIQPIGASLDGCGTSARNVCTNDDEVSPRIMHMSSSSFNQIDDSPIESRSFTIDAPGGVNVELFKDILRDTSNNSSFEPSYANTSDQSSLIIPFSFHQPPGFHDLRRTAGLNSLNNNSGFHCGNVQSNKAGVYCNDDPCNSFAGNTTY